MLTVYNLVLEVTRRCNMACDHCTRGEAQCKDMSPLVIGRTFSDISYISNLVLTGGEPTLAVPVIQQIIAEMKRRSVELESFYVVTNGLEAPVEFVHCLLDLYAMCCDKGDEDLCGLAVSQDQFHGTVDIPPIYRGLTFFRPEDKKELRYEGLINMGRAHDNGIGARELREPEPHLERYSDGTLYVEEPELYVSSNGNVIFGCNWSYEYIDSHCIGNILHDCWHNILTPYEVKEEVA